MPLPKRYAELTGNREMHGIKSPCGNKPILYGRGPDDTAIQVKAETGTAESLDVLSAQLAAVIKTWKEVEYPVAWRYIESCIRKSAVAA